MVFQSYALYPHMTVSENIGFALKTAGMKRNEVEPKVKEVRVTELLPFGSFAKATLRWSATAGSYWQGYNKATKGIPF